MGREDRQPDDREARREETRKKEIFQEKRAKEVAFIIGGGTSVNEVLNDPAMVERMNNYAVFGCNKAVESFDCDYMVYHDLKFSQEYSHLVTGFKGVGGVYAPLPSKVNIDQVNDTAIYFKNINGVSFDINKGLNTGNNCGVAALSVAVALGYKEIYLLGMDARFNNGKTHFHGGYGHGVNEYAYESFAHFFEYVGKYIKENRPDVKVYNCSYISLIDIEGNYFERINIRDVLDVDSSTTTRKRDIQPDVCGSP